MTKRALTLHRERLTDLTTEDLTTVVGAAQTNPGGLGGACDITDMPTVPDVNRCPTLFC